MATHPGVEPSCAPVAEGDMLAVVFVETPQNDAEFDLEVRLQPAGFRVSANEPPTNTVDCYTPQHDELRAAQAAGLSISPPAIRST
jgi:hypothetical protein